MTGNMLNGGEVIVDYLIREKVPYVFGLCGHGNISFIDAFYDRTDDIKTISVHHESVAGFMATSTIVSPASRPRRSPRAAPVPPTCRSASPTPSSTRCRSLR
jgi:Thiamine pyrophosphate enzyme, N-terminal TPP binding domain